MNTDMTAAIKRRRLSTVTAWLLFGALALAACSGLPKSDEALAQLSTEELFGEIGQFTNPDYAYYDAGYDDRVREQILIRHTDWSDGEKEYIRKGLPWIGAERRQLYATWGYPSTHHQTVTAGMTLDILYYGRFAQTIMLADGVITSMSSHLGGAIGATLPPPCRP